MPLLCAYRTGARFGWRDDGSMPKSATGRKGCNGRRAAGLPCQDCGYYPAHLAIFDITIQALRWSARDETICERGITAPPLADLQFC